MKTGRKILGAVVVAMLIIGGASSGVGQTKNAAKKPALAKTAATPAAFDRALLQPSSLTAKAPDVFEVKFTTTRGDFVVKVTRAWAPLGADRFYNLVQHHFFDNAAFFRVVPGFVVQFGLSAYPPVSAAWSRAPVKDDPVKASNHRGYVTYAMAGPNTRTTQLFISYGENARLDRDGFAPFGQVTEGMNNVEMIYEGYGERPDQGLIQAQGKAYLDKNFPKLDYIKTASVTSPAAAPAVKAPAKSSGKAPAKKSL